MSYKALFVGLFFTFIFSCKNTNRDNNAASAVHYSQILKIAGQKYQTDSLPEVIRYIDSSYAAINGGSIEARVEKYDFFCNIYNNGTHDFVKARTYADSMLQIVNKSTDKKFVKERALIANYNMGDANIGLKKYNDAFKYYYQAKAIAASAVDSFALQDYNYRLGMVMYRQQDYAAANNYFKTSLRQINYGELNFQTFIRKQELINNTALTFSKQGIYDSALIYYNQGLEYLEANRKLVGKRNLVDVAKGVIYGNLGQLYTTRQEFELAERFLIKSISINSRKGFDNRDAQFSQISLAHLYLVTNKTEKVLPLIDKLKASLDSLTNDEAELRLHNLSYKYYSKIGQPVKALQYFQAFVQLKDSLNTKDRDFHATDVDELLKSIENQYKIELLQKDNHVQKLYTLVAVVILILVLSIILLISRNAKKAKRHIVALTALNENIKDKKTKLREAMAKLKQESKSKDHILQIVAHDLRNPLHGIAGLTDILKSEDGLTSYQEHVLGLMQTSCNDAQQLINEILEVAGLAEVKKLSRQATDINVVVSNAVELLQPRALEKNQRIVFDLSNNPHPVTINREKITRVISNLINNSIKFSPANENIYVSTEQNNDGVIIKVKDKGIGIPANLAETVFNTFTPAKRPGTSGEKSFGLGLSICRQIVEAHEGKIWFDSQPGNGTTFHVQLS